MFPNDFFHSQEYRDERHQTDRFKDFLKVHLNNRMGIMLSLKKLISDASIPVKH